MGIEFGRNKYKSRRERRAKQLRNMKVTVIFVSIALIILIYKNRWKISAWIDTYIF